MTERRYNEDEVAAIFEHASETQSRTLPASGGGEGLTLAQLQDIGREVGIPAPLIDQAARSLDVSGRLQGRRLLGLPIGVGHTIQLDRPLTDEEWQRLVVDLRETFDARGRLRDDGPFKQWTNGNLEVLLEPTTTGQRLRMRTLKGSALRFMSMGAIFLALGIFLTIDASMQGNVPNSLLGAAFPLAMGIGFIGSNVLRLPGWARLRRKQMQEVAERLALAVASDADDAPSGASGS